MSTREEVLDALERNPDGLTSKELAPNCPACDCDAQIVARVVAGLRSEHFIHPGTELRDGSTIWILGGGVEPETVARISLPEAARPQAGHISDAARAIAGMRRAPEKQKAAAERAPDRAPTPVTTPSPARPAASQEEGETSMATKDALLKAILAAPEGLKTQEVAKAGGKDADKFVRELIAEKKVKRTGYARGTRYVAAAFKAAPPQERSAPKIARPAKKKVKAKRRAHKPIKVRLPEPQPPRPAAPINGDARFAINEGGELGIEKEGTKLGLDAEEFSRLREFIERSEQVWNVR